MSGEKKQKETRKLYTLAILSQAIRTRNVCLEDCRATC